MLRIVSISKPFMSNKTKRDSHVVLVGSALSSLDLAAKQILAPANELSSSIFCRVGREVLSMAERVGIRFKIEIA